MLNRLRFLILLLILHYIIPAIGQGVEGYISNSYNTTKADSLFNVAEQILKQQEIFKVSPDSVTDTEALNYTTQEILLLLQQANEILITNTEKKTLELKANSENNSKQVSILKNIFFNSKSILQINSNLISEHSNKENSDLRNLIFQLKDNSKLNQLGLKMANDIASNETLARRLYTDPINIEEICEYYNTDPDQTLYLIADTKSDEGAESATSEKITKGYSPFSEVYKEFVVFTDSVSKTKDSVAPKSETVNSSIKTKPTITKNTKTDISKMNKDSLFETAYRNELFPHELIRRFDKESLRRYWTIYQEQKFETTPITLNKFADSLKTSDIALNNISNPKLKEEYSVVKNSESEIEITKTDDEDNTVKTEIANTVIVTQPEEKTTQSTLLYSDINDNQIWYCIQIAASRTPVSDLFIQSVYKGVDPVKVRQEEDWYKYQYGHTTNYTTAKEKLKETTARGAFIVAYANNEKQVLWRTLLAKTSQKTLSSPSLVTFVIQVSANKKQLDTEQRGKLQQKYGGFIREIEEDGWYKYQIVVGSSYQEAIKKWKEIGTDISFVVPYYNNQKITMTEALKIK